MRTNGNSFHGFLLTFIVVAVASLATPAHAAQALPGDEILGYRVVDISTTPGQHWQWHVKLEVNYTYHPSHKKVIAGGYVLPFGDTLQTGHSYWGSESQPPLAVEETPAGAVIRGLQRVEVAVRLNVPEQSTQELRIFLYSPQENEFVSKSFPFQRTWKLSDLSPAPATKLKVAKTQPPSPPGAAPAAIKRTILPDGTVELSYPDGTLKRFFKGGIQIVPPKGIAMTYMYAQVQPATPPPQPTESQTVTWLQTHAKALLDIISSMVANDPTAIGNYLKYEGAPPSDYERVNKRTETLKYLLTP